MGNRELLSIKAALEEWRHWLEGVRHPFTVLTDHHNLEYLHGAKWLNSRQARWALFFTRFQFSVTYRPGSKNGKADALSRQFARMATAILAPVQCSLMEEIHRAHADEPPPAGCPATKVFVPLQFRCQVMQWVHEVIWLSTRNLRLKLPCRKLSPKFVGPFKIIRQVNAVAYRICPTFHMSLLKPLGSGEMSNVEPSPPLDIEGSPAYLVQALLDSRRVRS
ncbi:hypothetical protein QTP70_007196 [Hemibagrus guttatus]|uniref:Reverse transcriptase RNase H-like domain-containing protein n=1 Tax=Hemibagrus guttatus TaxID=175788 RepID=A0AAE0QQ41_9TELE|nr:hypothetical protein QTP70_007196 [Hemibagrus guttatus]KAK3558982.1 hypothetical protein QTP86_000099 [Hemibagrus guttatus]